MTKNKPLKYKHIQYQSLDSTSSELLRLSAQDADIAEFTVISTVSQTAGRGQGSNRWSSEAGKNLTFSAILRPNIPAEDHFYLTMCVSLGIAEAASAYIEGIEIKWPNDIYHHQDKICGILIQSTLSKGRIASCVIGAGLNINQREFESWVPNPTSMNIITSKEFDINQILDSVIDRIGFYYDKLQSGEFDYLRQRYHSQMYLKGLQSRFEDSEGKFTGTIIGCDTGGKLMIQREDKSISTYEFKQVKYLR